MHGQRPTVPLVFDYVDLRQRMRARRADDSLMEVAGLELPFSRTRLW